METARLPPQSSLHTCKAHLQQRRGDASVADVMASAHPPRCDEALRRLPHRLKMARGDVGARVSELAVGLGEG